MDERLLKAENIVFDVGNVLLSFQGEKVGRLLKKEIRDKLVPVMFGERHLWGEFDKGRESNEDIARRIAREGGVPGAVEDVLHTLYHFPEIMTPLPLYHMLDGLVAVCILSETDALHFPYFMDTDTVMRPIGSSRHSEHLIKSPLELPFSPHRLHQPMHIVKHTPRPVMCATLGKITSPCIRIERRVKRSV